MPRLSDTMTEGTIARWVKQQGEQVQKGDVLAEIETDKATMELEAYEAGVVEQVLVQEGQTVAIGQPIARIGAGGGAGNGRQGGAATAEPAEEPAQARAEPAEAPAEPADRAEPAAEGRAEPSAEPSGDAATTAPPAPGDEGRAAEPTAGQGTGQPARGADVGTVQSGGDGQGAPPSSAAGRARPADAETDGAEQEDGVRASPMARRIARERGIDLHTIRGSGPGGRIIRADVEAAEPAGVSPARTDGARVEEAPAEPPAPARAPAAPAPTPQPAAAAGGPDQEVEEVPLSNIRRVTGRRLVESLQQAPHFFLTTVVDVTELIQLRAQINERLAAAGDQTKVSLNDLILKACGLALREMPEVNVSFAGDKLLRKKRIHIGMAVALENGLIVPVLRDADQKSVGQIAREAKALIDRARSGKLQPADYTGGTFTVSNLGMFGIEHFTAVINPPEAAILAVGASAAEPVVLDGKVEIRERMRLTLSVDHRALDGANGARFLQVLKRLLETPMRILL
jgi:pyruvate dehydrogenase E2 component (dihydrolipoamide acetyltransferase)